TKQTQTQAPPNAHLYAKFTKTPQLVLTPQQAQSITQLAEQLSTKEGEVNWISEAYQKFHELLEDQEFVKAIQQIAHFKTIEGINATVLTSLAGAAEAIRSIAEQLHLPHSGAKVSTRLPKSLEMAHFLQQLQSP